MSIRLIHRKDVVAGVPDSWARQYRSTHWGGDKREKTRQLLALKGTPDLTAENVDRIIGNTSWTALQCSECGRDNETVVRIGEEPDYDARWVDLCAGCASEALNALQHSLRLPHEPDDGLDV